MSTMILVDCPCNDSHRSPMAHSPTCKKRLQSLINPKYELIEFIGEGAYGVVFSAVNKETKEKVAIKRIINAFENPWGSLSALREVRILRHLDHDNIIGLKDIMIPSNADKSSFKDVYLVYQLMNTDLKKIIKSTDIVITDDHCKYFLLQILLGLNYIQSANILHRDLKPENLLVDANLKLKICDFGLSRVAANAHGENMTEYVVSRWYRAPELLLSSYHYGFAIDVWSVGCIFAELLSRKPIFREKNEIEQIKLILSILGTPKYKSELEFIKSTRCKKFVSSLPHSIGISFADLYPNANPLALDLLCKMLTFDPSKRITVIEALRHPYLKDLCSESNLINSTMKHSSAELDVKEYCNEDEEMMRQLMWEEMLHYYPETDVAATVADADISDNNKKSAPARRSITWSKMGCYFKGLFNHKQILQKQMASSK